MRINEDNNVNFGSLSKLSKPLEAFYNKNSVMPILLIETGVTLGRTYEANKKGGKKEAIERFVEQGVSAVVWLWGVQAIRDIVNFAADKLKINKNKTFKDVNIISSTLLATAFIGFVLPKINHFISSKLTKKEDKTKNEPLKPLSFEEFKYKNSTSSNKNPSFKSLSGFANLLENNSAARLLITDTGVIAGRYKNGRNKYERIEGLFRDISSIFFYLASTKLIVKALNKIANNTDISPMTLEKVVQEVKEGKDINELKKSDDLIRKFFENTKATDYASAKKAAIKTIHKNFGFYALGTAFSAFALGILIPKAQYLIRRKLTNKDEFPGNDNYSADVKPKESPAV